MSHMLDPLPPAEALRRPRSRFPWRWLIPALCLAFLLGCGAYAWAVQRQKAPAEAPKIATVTLTQLIPEGAGTPVRADIALPEERFTLAQDGDTVTLVGETATLNDAAARELLASGASVTARQQLASGDPAFGLEEPSAVATYTYADGQTLTLTLGAAVPTGEGVYAAVSGDAHVYVVNNSLLRLLTAGKNALYALPDFSEVFTAQTLLSATITRLGSDTVCIRRVTEANPFNTVAELTEPIHYPANSERAAEIYLALEDVKPTGVAAIDGADEDWGLDNPLAVITLTGSRTMTLTLGRTESLCTLRMDDEPAVYTVDEDSLAFLTQVTVSYLAEQLPGLVALNQITALKVTAGEETFDVQVDQAAGSFVLNGQTVAQEDFLPAYQQLIGLLIERYVAEPETVGEPRVLLEYTLQDGTEWTLAFAAYDDSFDLVVREDCARFLISRSKVDAAVEALRALMH